MHHTVLLYICRGSFVRSCYGSPVWSIFPPPSCRSRTASKLGPQLPSVRLTAHKSVCYIVQTYVRYPAQTYVRYTVQTSVSYKVQTYVRYTAPTYVGYTTQTCYRLQLRRTDFSFTTQTSRYRLHSVTLHRRLYVTSHSLHYVTLERLLYVTSHRPSRLHRTVHPPVTVGISVRYTAQMLHLRFLSVAPHIPNFRHRSPCFFFSFFLSCWSM